MYVFGVISYIEDVKITKMTRITCIWLLLVITVDNVSSLTTRGNVSLAQNAMELSSTRAKTLTSTSVREDAMSLKNSSNKSPDSFSTSVISRSILKKSGKTPTISKYSESIRTTKAVSDTSDSILDKTSIILDVTSKSRDRIQRNSTMLSLISKSTQEISPKSVKALITRKRRRMTETVTTQYQKNQSKRLYVVTDKTSPHLLTQTVITNTLDKIPTTSSPFPSIVKEISSRNLDVTREKRSITANVSTAYPSVARKDQEKAHDKTSSDIIENTTNRNPSSSSTVSNIKQDISTTILEGLKEKFAKSSIISSKESIRFPSTIITRKRRSISENVSTTYPSVSRKDKNIAPEKTFPKLLSSIVASNTTGKIPLSTATVSSIKQDVSTSSFDGLNGKIVTSSIIPSKEPIQFSSKLVTRERRSITETVSNAYPSASRKDKEIAHDKSLTKLFSSNIIENTTNSNPSSSATVSSIKQDISSTILEEPESPVCKDYIKIIQRKAKSVKLSLQNITLIEKNTLIFIEVRRVDTVEERNQTANFSDKSVRIMNLQPGKEYEVKIFAALTRGGRFVKSQLPCRNATRFFTRPKIKKNGCKKIKMQCNENAFHAEVDKKGMLGVNGIIFRFYAEREGQSDDRYIKFREKNQIKFTTNITRGFTYNVSAFGVGPGNSTSEKVCFMKSKCVTSLNGKGVTSSIIPSKEPIHFSSKLVTRERRSITETVSTAYPSVSRKGQGIAHGKTLTKLSSSSDIIENTTNRNPSSSPTVSSIKQDISTTILEGLKEKIARSSIISSKESTRFPSTIVTRKRRSITETASSKYPSVSRKDQNIAPEKTFPKLLSSIVASNTTGKIPLSTATVSSIKKDISTSSFDGLNGKIVTSSIIPSKEPIQFSSKLVTRERRSITETVSNVYPSVSRKDQEIAHDETLTKLISSNIIENTTNRNPSSSSTVSSIKQDISTTIPKEPESPVCKDDIQIIQRKAKSVKLSLQNINLIELNTFIFIEVRRVDIVEERNQTANISDKSVKIMDLEPGKEYEVKIFAALTRGGRFVKSQLPCRNATRFFTRPKIKKEGCKKIKMQCNENTFEAVVDRKGMLGVTDITFSFQAEEEGQNDDRYIEFGEKKQIKFTTNITRGFTYNISAFGIGPGNLTSENVCFMKSKCVTKLLEPVCNRGIVENITSNQIIFNTSAIGLHGDERYLQISMTDDGDAFSTKFFVNFTSETTIIDSLNASTNYSIKIQSAGANKEYGDGCYFDIQTRPNDPHCSAFGVSDIFVSSANLTFNDSISPDVNIFEIRKIFGELTETLTNTLSHPLHLKNLISGSNYQIEIKSVSKYNDKSTGRCVLDFRTVPASVGVISTSVGVHHFNASWEKPTGVFTNFTVRTICLCSSNCSFGNGEQVKVIRKTHILIEGLSPFSHCNMSVLVNAGRKVSLPSTRFDIRTKEAVPDAVTMITLKTIKGTMYVYWKKPTRANGIILRYTAKLYLNSSLVKAEHILANKTRFLQLSGLLSGKCYRLTLAAKTRAGYGQSTFRHIYTAESVPSAVMHLNSSATPTTIAVQWMTPMQSNGIITRYVIKLIHSNKCLQQTVLLCKMCRNDCGNSSEIQSSGDSTWNNETKNDCKESRRGHFNQYDKEFQKTLYGLTPYTNYDIVVFASTSAGDGQTQNISERTGEDLPGVVQNIQIRPNGKSLDVSFNPPKRRNGRIMEYEICYQPQRTSNSCFQDSVKYGNHSVRITSNHTDTEYTHTLLNLHSFWNYTVGIRARTSKGYGNWTFRYQRTNPAAPSEVNSLNSSALSPSKILVEWMLPTHSNGIITSYTIKVIDNKTCVQHIVLHCDDCSSECGEKTVLEKEEHSLANNYTEDNFTECQKTTRSRSFNHSDVKFREIISDLTPQTSYDIVVFAATLAGGGKETKIKEWTKGDVPGNVRNLQIKPNGTGFAISFSPPEQRNGKILEYEISYEPQYVNKSCLRNIEKYNIQNVSLRPLNPEQKDTGYKHALIDLYPFWNYTVGVRARTSEGYGNRTLAYEITNTAEPGHIENLTVVNVTHDQIFLKWKEPCFTNGIIKHYLLMISSNSDDGRNFTSKTTFITISELFPYTSYNITVFTVSEEDLIDIGVTEANITTKCSVPQSPADLKITNKTSTTFMLSWKEPEFETCLTKYNVTATDVKDKAIHKYCLTEGFHNVSCTIKGLDEYWEYDIKLVAVTVNGTTPWNGTLKERTSPSAPGNVTSLRIVPERDILAPRSIKIQFNPPLERERNGIITSYVIVYWNQRNMKKNQTQKYVIDDISLDSNEVVLSRLRPDNYTVQIYATSTHDDSGLNKITRSNIILEDGAPPLFASMTGNLLSIQPARQTNVENDQTQFPIVISNSILCNTESGEVIERGIIISEVSQITGTGERLFRGKKVSFENRKVQEYSTWSRVYELDNMQPYIATDSLNVRCGTGRRKRATNPTQDLTFIVGEDGNCESKGDYCNGYLHPGKTYRARIYICTKGGCTESAFMSEFSTAPNLVPTIVGVTTGVLLPFLVVITVVVLVLVYRRKRKQETPALGMPLKVTVEPGRKRYSKTIIQKSNISDHVNRLHKDSNDGFSEEYKHLKEQTPTHTTEAAAGQATRIKNRYTNILAYDHSRVKLLPLDDEDGTDYINANYIPGYTSEREYIATQGPLECTKDDFWRMIWEQDVSVIVMLTQLVERGRRKCDMYWPSALNEPVYFGDLIVEMTSESTLDDYTLRVISVELGNKKKRIKQFHYLKWPDMGCPETTWLLLNFAQTMRIYLPHNCPGPIVVHCSAGVGRTGTFIAVDHLMQHVRDHDTLDIFNLVLGMRNNRSNMVQTEDQYVFIHDCMKDYIEELQKEDDVDEDVDDGDVDATYENTITIDSTYVNYSNR